MLFTSALTTAPALILLSQFAATIPLPTLAILGGFGAMLGDYVIFRFVKDRMTEDVHYLLSFSKKERFQKIFKTKVFRFFVPLIAVIIIASPIIPDEIGITMLGLSKMKTRYFFLVSFLANSIGVLIIGLVARALLH